MVFSSEDYPRTITAEFVEYLWIFGPSKNESIYDKYSIKCELPAGHKSQVIGAKSLKFEKA
jgi:hypothetical protein